MKRRPSLPRGTFDYENLELGVKYSRLSKLWSEYKEPIGEVGSGGHDPCTPSMLPPYKDMRTPKLTTTYMLK